MIDITPLILPTVFFFFVAYAAVRLVNLIANRNHERDLERLEAHARVNVFTPDALGNYQARYFPEMGRVIHPNSGNAAPPNVPYQMNYSPNNSNTISGKPLNLGDNREQRVIAINRYQPRSEEPAPPPELPGAENTAYLSDVEPEPTPEQAAANLLQSGLSIRSVERATGMSYHAIREIHKGLNLN